jgi:hypothetical protein
MLGSFFWGLKMVLNLRVLKYIKIPNLKKLKKGPI